MLPEIQQSLIDSCQSKSLSTFKRLCVRMATRSQQTGRKPRTTCKSSKDWVQCLNAEAGLLLWRTATRKKHHPLAQWIVWLKNPQTIFFGLTNCRWVAWSVASHLEMIEQICGAQSSWSQTCIMNMFRPMCYSKGSLAKSPWTPFHLGFGSSHWWLTRKVSNAGLGESGVTRHFFHWNFKTSSYFTFSGLCFQPNLGYQGTGMTLGTPRGARSSVPLWPSWQISTVTWKSFKRTLNLNPFRSLSGFLHPGGYLEHLLTKLNYPQFLQKRKKVQGSIECKNWGSIIELSRF